MDENSSDFQSYLPLSITNIIGHRNHDKKESQSKSLKESYNLYKEQQKGEFDKDYNLDLLKEMETSIQQLDQYT